MGRDIKSIGFNIHVLAFVLCMSPVEKDKEQKWAKFINYLSRNGSEN